MFYTNSDAPISFAKNIFQCPQQNHIIQNSGIFTFYCFDDYSASWEDRVNDHNPYGLDNLLQTP